MWQSKPKSPVEHCAYLALGSNLGDRGAYLSLARELLEKQAVKIIRRSPIYDTPPIGPQDQSNFLNQALEVKTIFSPFKLLEYTQSIERQLGRIRIRHWGPRTIDIDILFYEGENINTPILTIPHPHIHERAFVLRPLADIAPNITLHGQKIHELLKQTDQAGIQPYISA